MTRATTQNDLNRLAEQIERDRDGDRPAKRESPMAIDYRGIAEGLARAVFDRQVTKTEEFTPCDLTE